MLKALWIKDFILRNKSYAFDRNGDINLGYDVTMWRSDGDTKIYVQDIVAEFHIDINNFTYTNYSTTQQFLDVKVKSRSTALKLILINTHTVECVY